MYTSYAFARSTIYLEPSRFIDTSLVLSKKERVASCILNMIGLGFLNSDWLAEETFR